MKRFARVALALCIAAGALLPLGGCRKANAEQTARTVEAFESIDFAQCAFSSECEFYQSRRRIGTREITSEKGAVEGAYDAREGSEIALDLLYTYEHSYGAENETVSPTKGYEVLFLRGDKSYTDSGESAEELTLGTCTDLFRTAGNDRSLSMAKSAASGVDSALEKAVPGHGELFAAAATVYREDEGFRLEKTVPFEGTVKEKAASAYRTSVWHSIIQGLSSGSVTLTALFDASYGFLSCTVEYSASAESDDVSARFSVRTDLTPGEAETQSLSGCNARRTVFKEGDSDRQTFQEKINGTQIGGNLTTGYKWNFTFVCEAIDKETLNVSLIKGKNEFGDSGSDYRETKTFKLEELEEEAAQGNSSILTVFVVSFEFPVNRYMFQMGGRFTVSVSTAPSYGAQILWHEIGCKIETVSEYSLIE